MPKEKHRNMKNCIYCGSNVNMTVDHIPPKNLFSNPRPQLITVPCCKKCNLSFSKDDEYLRLQLSLRHDVFPHADVQKNWESINHGLQRASRPGLKMQLLNNMMLVDVKTSAGIYIGKAPCISVELGRLVKVVTRMMEGFYYQHKNKRLPDGIKPIAYSLNDMNDLDVEAKTHLVKCIDYVKKSTITRIGDGVFSYYIRFLDDAPDYGVFLCTFYERVCFLGFYVDRN